MPAYKVVTPTATRIVKAKNAATAINHCIRPGVTAEALSVDELIDLMSDGKHTVETAGTSDEVEGD